MATTGNTPLIGAAERSNANNAGAPQPSNAKKSGARVALANLDELSSKTLRECCKPFGIETIPVPSEHALRFREEKFEACAMVLDSEAVSILDAIRTSPLNRHIVIYGFCHDNQLPRQFSRYGINIVLDFPAERAPLTRAIRSTYYLLTHEFRRYVRIPVVMEITIQTGARRLSAISEEISVGGMSIRVTDEVAPSAPIVVDFILPNSRRVSAGAVVCWMNPGEKKIGLRFDPADERRLQVREWIEEYLVAV